MRFWLLGIMLLTSLNTQAGECDFFRNNRCRSCDELRAFAVGSYENCAYLCPNREPNSEATGTTGLYYM